MAMTILPSTYPPPKRKLDAAANDNSNKRARVGKSDSQIPPRLPLEPHEAFLAELQTKYDVATLSVISSTSINKRMDQMLAHLGRFHPSDLAVLPGVVLMHSRSRDAAKMVTLIEMARRNIQQSGQKWYQYNRLYEVEAKGDASDNTVIKETVLGGEGGGGEGHGVSEHNADGDDDAENDYFESAPNVFERAILGQPKPQPNLYMSIFLSRVPIPELGEKSFITAQSNSHAVEQQRKRQLGR